MICASLSDLRRAWIVGHACAASLPNWRCTVVVLYGGCRNFPKSAISRFLGCSMGTVASRRFVSCLFFNPSPACEPCFRQVAEFVRTYLAPELHPQSVSAG